MYDRLTPLGRNVTDAVLAPSADGTGYFKSAQLLARRRPVADHRRDGQRRGGADARASGATPTACRTSTPPPTTASSSARATSSPPTAACCSTRRATTASRARSTCPGAPAIHARPRALRLPADGARSGAQVTRAAGPRRCSAAGAGRPPGAARHRHLPRRHQPLVRAQPARRAAVRPRRHLRAQRDQGAVPRRGRRRGGRRTRCSSTPRATGSAARAARRSTRTCASATIPRRRRRRPRRAPHQTTVSARAAARASCGSSRARFESAGVDAARAAPRRAAATAARREGVERPARRRRALGDRHADHGRRPADRLQLPRPDDGDRPLRADASAPAARPPRRSPATC